LRLLLLQARHLAQAAQVSRGLTELGAEEGLHEVPGHAGPSRAAADADDVHVVVLDALRRGEMVMDQPGPDARNLVRADGGPDTAATDGHTALDRACRDRLAERDDEVRIVIVRVELLRAEINDVVSSRTEPLDQVLLQFEP